MGNPNLSSVSICNSGLLKIGGDIISSLTDGSRAANICNTLYSTLRDEVMGSAPWRFATAQAKLSPQATSPLFDYAYAYVEPSNCLRVLTCNGGRWTEQSGLLLSDSPTVEITYLWQNTDETSWDSRFAEALSWRIAMESALALVQSQSMYAIAEKGYKDALAQARAMNAVVGTSQQLVADIWSGARKGMGYRNIAGPAGPLEYYD